MDKNKIKALRDGNLPRDVWRNTLCNILEEMDDRDKKPKFWYTSDKLNSLSFTQAITILLEDRKPIAHVSWDGNLKLIPYHNASGFALSDGKECYTHFIFNTDILHSNWRVLDK